MRINNKNSIPAFRFSNMHLGVAMTKTDVWIVNMYDIPVCSTTLAFASAANMYVWHTCMSYSPRLSTSLYDIRVLHPWMRVTNNETDIHMLTLSINFWRTQIFRPNYAVKHAVADWKQDTSLQFTLIVNPQKMLWKQFYPSNHLIILCFKLQNTRQVSYGTRTIQDKS